MTEHKSNFPDFYITAPQPCPYLSYRKERKLFTHLTKDKPNVLIDNLLKGGFRRSQNIAYMPYCDNCSACVSVRIVVDEFEPKRTLKRAQNKNADLKITRMPANPTIEQYHLFKQYLHSRHAQGEMADMSLLDYGVMVEESVIKTFITEYRLSHNTEEMQSSEDETLIGVALCDYLSDGISMVYSFFDTTLDSRSLGTYMIMEQIQYAKKINLPYVYLGYWINGSQKMKYKTRFKPQERLTPKGWVRFE
ncbi:MAG: arginyltransferase [Pseudomonadota bacterium]